MAEVFKTNVEGISESQELIAMLLEHFPDARINFDLQDCDHILRVEGTQIAPEKIIGLLHAKNFQCIVLE